MKRNLENLCLGTIVVGVLSGLTLVTKASEIKPENKTLARVYEIKNELGRYDLDQVKHPLLLAYLKDMKQEEERLENLPDYKVEEEKQSQYKYGKLRLGLSLLASSVAFLGYMMWKK